MLEGDEVAGIMETGFTKRRAAWLQVVLPSLLFLLASPQAPAQHEGHGGGFHGGESQRGRPGFQGGPRNGPRMEGPRRPGPRPENGQHLPQWFVQHRGMSPWEQEQALRREPGFSRLAPEQQQRLINRLHRLDMVPPQERQRIAEWNERFMALPPERQQEIRGASQALAQMPPERRRAMRQAFHNLRNMPPEERQEALDSARFQAEYTPQERTILSNLLSIEPYVPPQ